MPTTHEQSDFAHAKSFVLCSLQPTKSACSAAAEKCLYGVGQPLSSVSGRKRYNTLDFASKIVCQQGCSRPYWKPRAEGLYPSGHPPVFVTCVYTNLPQLVYCTLSENTKIPQTSSYNWDVICGIFYRTHNTYIVGRADSYVKSTPQQLPV